MAMKIGILSFAHLHAESYVQNLRAIPGVEMIGVADDDAARGQHSARQFGVGGRAVHRCGHAGD